MNHNHTHEAGAHVLASSTTGGNMIFPCSPCQELYDGWSTYQRPASRWIQYMNVTRSIEARKTQIAEHYELINRQCAAIKDSCRRKCEHLKEQS